MSQIIQDSSGAEIEVFTKDEVDAAVEEYKTSNPDKSEELARLQAILEEKEEDLAALKDKDFNFSRLRKQVDDLQKEIGEKVNAAKKDVLDSVLKEHYNETLSTLAGGDEELEKSIEFQYNRLQDAASTKEEIAKKLRDAWVLATKREEADVLNTTVLSSGGVGRIKTPAQQKFTPEEKQFARKLAAAGGIQLEDKDFDR